MKRFTLLFVALRIDNQDSCYYQFDTSICYVNGKAQPQWIPEDYDPAIGSVVYNLSFNRIGSSELPRLNAMHLKSELRGKISLPV